MEFNKNILVYAYESFSVIFTFLIMKGQEMNLMEWQQHYRMEGICVQASLTAGTLFHSTNLLLSKWFGAIYLVASDQGSISALRLSRQINVSWTTTSRMLRKIRIAMGHRDSIYRLHELVEIDDALIGGQHTGGKAETRC